MGCDPILGRFHCETYKASPVPSCFLLGEILKLTTIERRGRGEKEQPEVGPKGEWVGSSESKDTESTEVEGIAED